MFILSPQHTFNFEINLMININIKINNQQIINKSDFSDQNITLYIYIFSFRTDTEPSTFSDKHKSTMRNICTYILLGILTLSSIYLFYVNIRGDLKLINHLRFWLFFLQHVILIVSIFYKLQYEDEVDPYTNIKWLLSLTGILFLLFAGVQIYGIITDKYTREYFGEPDDTVITFSTITYFHLYYQANIYNGIFNIFCLVMWFIYKINERNHTRRMDQLLGEIEELQYEARGDEDPCSICLNTFQKQEKVYKLKCNHIFHIDCLEHWLKQQFTCPLCRADIAQNQQNHHQDFYNNHDI